MNQADNDISTKMIDSLLNYETVKYFNNEKFEFNRLDESLEDYELAANQSRHSLSLLNIAQTFIIMFGITVMLVMSAYGIKNGDIDVGGFVVINAYMFQLYQPLNWLGSVYREIRQALTDMEICLVYWKFQQRPETILGICLKAMMQILDLIMLVLIMI